MTEYPPAPPPPPQQPGAYGPPPGGPSGPRAGFGVRLVAVIVDSIILLIASGIVVGIVYAMVGEDGAIISGYAAFILGTFAYFTFFEGGPSGQSPGKKALSIRVIDFNTGGPIGYGRALGRILFRWFISSFVCYLGYLWMLWDREKQTWHDKVCTCVVVPTDAYPVP